MRKILTVLFSASVAALAFILAREHVPFSPGVQVAGASLFAAPVPVIVAALAFPALYLVWEQSEM